MNFSFDAIDIFSGCGGLSCGLTQAGFKVRAAVEIEDSIASTYLAYPPLAHVNVLHGHEHGDICKLTGEEILKAAHIDKDSIYLFAGCPPCQNFSRQNRENKHKSDEERKRLLFEYLRVIHEILPPFVLMENVQGITTQMNKEILSEFLAKLRRKYVVACDVLNAADYGVPQLRHRFVLHAVRKDIADELAKDGIQVSLPTPTHSATGGNGLERWRTVREAIGDLPPIKAGETYPDDGIIHNHKCCSLDPINQRRIRSIRTEFLPARRRSPRRRRTPGQAPRLCPRRIRASPYGRPPPRASRPPGSCRRQPRIWFRRSPSPCACWRRNRE